MYASEIIDRFINFYNHDAFSLIALSIETESGDHVTLYKNMFNLKVYNLEKSQQLIKSFDLSLMIACFQKTDIQQLIPDYQIIIDEVFGLQRLVVMRYNV